MSIAGKHEMKINTDKRFEKHMERVKQTSAFQLETLKLEVTESLCCAMEDKQISRAELADRIGTSRAYVTKLLRGDVNFTLESLMRIAQAMECELQPPRFNSSSAAKVKSKAAVKQPRHTNASVIKRA